MFISLKDASNRSVILNLEQVTYIAVEDNLIFFLADGSFLRFKTSTFPIAEVQKINKTLGTLLETLVAK